MPDNHIRIPASAADSRPPLRHPMAQAPDEAYIVNPIAGQEKLTPIDALRAIGVLAATLEADEIHHEVLRNRKAPE
jgi:hypothetical protein